MLPVKVFHRTLLPEGRAGSVLYRTSLNYISVGLLTAYGESPVAFAGYSLDHLPVIDAQIPAPVTDRASVLHGPGRDRNTGASHAQVLGDSLLSNLNHILFHAVYKKQQPHRKSLLGRMENGAGGTL